jgi:hypothetical protein
MKWHVCFLVVCSGCYVLVELYFQWVEVSIKKKMLHKIIADIIFFFELAGDCPAIFSLINKKVFT